jgi:malate synthase
VASTITITRQGPEWGAEVLTPEAVDFVALLLDRFDEQRRRLLTIRRERQERFLAGDAPGFRDETREIREGRWQVAPVPPPLQDRRVEITGPVERKMMINALNSGAKVFMADFEDALSPSWENVLQGQVNCRDAVRRTIRFTSPDGRNYELADETAVLVVRPRGWHLPERHVELSGHAVSASLFDFGLYAFHNARELLDRGLGPYFYLPKLESHEEARLWNEVFELSETQLGLPAASIKATVLIETLPAAFEMEEILFELRDRIVGLNAGRWDYIFSMIKTFRNRPEFILPDRAQVTMTIPFMRAYTELLVKTCHDRGAHAIGGMSAFIPNRRNPEVTDRALEKVREDKEREARDGFDGTWVAHPALVPVARECFDRVMGDRPHQKERTRYEVSVSAGELIDVAVPGAGVTVDGVRNNISVALQYLSAWLAGSGAVAIFDLMEDAATAEISRAQLWQWLHNQVELEDGRDFALERYRELRREELAKLGDHPRLAEAAEILDSLVLPSEFSDFLTLPAYQRID